MAKPNNRFSDKDLARGKSLRDEGRKWLSRIEGGLKREKNWREDAERAVLAYTGEGSRDFSPTIIPDHVAYSFNILYANVETIVPAIINSPPAPDIRRRFADDDPVAKDVAEILERSIRVQIDDSHLQTELEAEAQDGFLAGRGLVRLRFKSDITDDLPSDAELEDDVERENGTTDDDDEPAPKRKDGVEKESGYVQNERICFEAVSWRDYAHGPARRWEDRPWDAFRHVLSSDDCQSFSDSSMVAIQSVGENAVVWGESDDDVTIWEIWDKKTRAVKFVHADTGVILKTVDDPLGWSGFFCIATPVQPVEVNGRLMPVNPFSIYRALAEELDITTKRIKIIAEQMRVRGWYPGDAAELSNMMDAGDVDWVPISNPELWAQNGGLEGAVAFWPIDRFVQALRELYVQREQTKQAIYEITGISDIIRGQGAASESATAQNIKTQWGSLRVQKFQRMMQRTARELFVMMAEIIPAKFAAKSLQDMTGIQLIPTEQDEQPVLPPPPTGNQEQDQQAQQQAQQAEQARQQKLQHLTAVNELLKQKLQTYYRIDVESDSTVKADLTRQKSEVAEFLQGAAAYWAAVGPLVQTGALPKEVAVEIFASNSRLFNLGKSVEDVLDKMVNQAKEEAANPQPPAPNPEMIKAQVEQQKVQGQAQIAQAKAQSDQAAAQVQIQTIQAKAQADMAKTNADVEAKRVEMQGRMAELQAKMQADTQLHSLDMQKGQLELQKIAAEIEKIKAGTASTVIASQAKTDLAERSQTFKETQAKESKE